MSKTVTVAKKKSLNTIVKSKTQNVTIDSKPVAISNKMKTMKIGLIDLTINKINQNN